MADRGGKIFNRDVRLAKDAKIIIGEDVSIDENSIDMPAAGVVQSSGTGANGLVLKNLKTQAASSLSGTELEVEIDINGTPYYFKVYPTSS